MKKRLILLAGLGVGFILGSRTGRQSYERLKAQAQDLWTDPRVQDTVEKANQSIREKSPVVADAVQDTVEKVNAAATGVDSSVSEFDGDEDGSASTSGASGSGSGSSTSSSAAPSTGAASPGANAASTGAGAASTGAGASSTAGKSGSGAGKSTSGSAKSGSGAGKSSTSATGSNSAKSDSSKSSVPKPSEVKHDPHAAGAAKSQDTLADPERSLDDEGPAGVSSED